MNVPRKTAALMDLVIETHAACFCFEISIVHVLIDKQAHVFGDK